MLSDRRGHEIYLGFGERSNAVDMAGPDVENYTSDGAVRPEDRAYPKPFLPPWAVSDRDDATYFPVPWMLSSAGYASLGSLRHRLRPCLVTATGSAGAVASRIDRRKGVITARLRSTGRVARLVVSEEGC